MVLAVFCLAWGGLVAKGFILQVSGRQALLQAAQKEYQRVIKLTPVRGDILDAHGEKLAVTLMVDSVYASPRRVRDPERTAQALAGALGLKAADVLEKLNKNNSFVWIERQVAPDVSARIREMDLKGVGFIKEGRRFYPNRELAAHALGFVGVDSQGLGGLEIAYDTALSGTPLVMAMMRDALGRAIDGEGDAVVSQLGDSLELTLDRRVQYITEKALAEAVASHRAKRGMAVVMRPATGEILALAVAPAYNPNAFGDYSAAARRNVAVTDTFDPGSTLKLFLVAAALEEGVVTPRYHIDCEDGDLKVGNRVVHDSRAYGIMPVSQVVKYSSNIGAVKIGRLLGPDRFYRYLNRFGFGARTGVDLPAESPGLIRPFRHWTEVDAANIAFGQGLSVTAVQMAAAVSAIANGGRLMRPFIVRRVIGPDGTVKMENQPRLVRAVVSPETAAKVAYMLKTVVEEGGTGTRAALEGYESAGKTGTAQKFDPAGGAYSQTDFVASFVGFMPYRNPELTVVVVIDEPHPQIFGGVVAGPVFKEIGQKVLPLFNVPPSADPPVITTNKKGPDRLSRAPGAQASRGRS